MPESYDVHTCSAECPCQHGGEPVPDFLPVEAAVPRIGWFAYLEHLADVAEARRTSPRSGAPRSTEPNTEET